MIKLRKVRISDISLLKYWDTKPHIIEALGEDGPFDWDYEVPRTVAWREFFISEIEKEPIGFVQIIDPKEEETHYWGKIEEGLSAIDLWIGEEKNLGKGYGTAMMKQVLSHCFTKRKSKAVLIDPLYSNKRSQNFYEKLGFIRIGRKTFRTSDCLIYRLDKDEDLYSPSILLA